VGLAATAPRQSRVQWQYYIVLRYTENGLSQDDRILGMKRLSLADYRALAEFRYQIRGFFAFSDKAVQAAGLERGQYQLMLAIKGIPEGMRPNIRNLANRLRVQHNSAVELINRLETGGYVHRERAQDDRREVLLALTPNGERVLAELALHHHEELQSAAPRLVAALKSVMKRKIGVAGGENQRRGGSAPDASTGRSYAPLEKRLRSG
jgi:DNA-binding MarR family transcriptional regulator